MITSFDKKYIDENIYNYMTKEVITVPQNFSIVSAIQKFEKYDVGKLPVIEYLHSKKILKYQLILLKILLRNFLNLREEEMTSTVPEKWLVLLKNT